MYINIYYIYHFFLRPVYSLCLVYARAGYLLVDPRYLPVGYVRVFLGHSIFDFRKVDPTSKNQ